MSISVSSSGVEITGVAGDTQGGYSADLVSAPSGAIGVQYAYRAYFDSFSHAGPVSPYTRSAYNSTYCAYEYPSSNWDHFFHFGLSFNNTHPTKDLAESFPYYSDNRGFIGTRSAETQFNTPRHQLDIQVFTLNQILEWVLLKGPSIVGSRQNARFDYRQTKASGLAQDFGISGGLTSDATTAGIAAGWASSFPTNPTDGAKFTLGLDFRIGGTNQYQVDLRVFVDTKSLAEGSLMDVFTSYDYMSYAFAFNLSTTTINSDDAWVHSDGSMLFPGRVMMGWGGPGQKFILKKFLYRYLTP